MRILLATSFWGHSYAEKFTRYSLQTLASEGNVPRLSEKHDVTLHIIAPEQDLAFLRADPLYSWIGSYCTFDIVSFEELDLDPNTTPKDLDGKKYDFLSHLQNIAITASLDYDALVINYADFIWSDGALANSIELLGDGEGDGCDAVFSFNIPVDEESGKKALDNRRIAVGGAHCMPLPPRDAARISLDHMHREARLRFVDGDGFTQHPSYLMWKVEDYGAVVRAYHYSILAIKVRPNDPIYRQGITEGTLDGHYSAIIADSLSYRVAEDSDSIFIFTLYDTDIASRAAEGYRAEDIVGWFFINGVKPGQRALGDIPVKVRAAAGSRDKWNAVINQSQSFIDRVRFAAETRYLGKDEFRGTLVGKVMNIYRSLSSSIIGKTYRFVFNESLRSKIRLILWNATVANKTTDLDRLQSLEQTGTPRSEEEVVTLSPEELEHQRLDQARLTAFFEGYALEDLVELFDAPDDDVIILNRSTDAEANVGTSISVPGKLWAAYHAVLFAVGKMDHQSQADKTRLLHAKSLELVDYILEQQPLWADAADWRANIQFLTGDLQAAKASFEKAEGVRREAAKHAGYAPDMFVYMPRSCSVSIGLMTHLRGYVMNKEISGDDRVYRLIAPKESIVNPAYLSYFDDRIEIYRNPKDIARVEGAEQAYAYNWNWYIPTFDGNSLDVIHRQFAKVFRDWVREERPPLFTLQKEHKRKLGALRKHWGMKDDDWFVCLHVRSPGYHGEAEDGANSFRNTPFSDYHAAIEAIIDAGGWVIRMGDPSMPMIDYASVRHGNRVIDYAHSPAKTDVADVALLAGCRLLLASPSGLVGICNSFGVPCVLVNYPMQVGLPSHPDDMVIYQRPFSKEKNKYLSFEECFSSGVTSAITSYLLEECGVELHRNTPEEIVEVLKEGLGLPRQEQDMDKVNAMRTRFRELSEKYNFGGSATLGAHHCVMHPEDFD